MYEDDKDFSESLKNGTIGYAMRNPPHNRVSQNAIAFVNKLPSIGELFLTNGTAFDRELSAPVPVERTGTLERCSCIFHWFSGTSDELHRAVHAGCWFSINEMMLRTRRGREYARQLPADRLLLETDLPPGENVPFVATEIIAQLERTIEQLGTIRGTDIKALACDNSERLLA